MSLIDLIRLTHSYLQSEKKQLQSTTNDEISRKIDFARFKYELFTIQPVQFLTVWGERL